MTDTTICRIVYGIMSAAVSTPKILTLASLERLNQTELIEVVSAGLPARLARELAGSLAITMEDMSSLLRVNPRTLQRRFDEGALDLGESERLWELSRLFHRATEVLEGQPAAVHWFKNPVAALGWVTPLVYARTAVGRRELDKMLGRIEHGVFS